MLMSYAYAQGTAGHSAGLDIMSLLPIILIVVVFYFLLIRPQQRKAREHKTMLDALRRGDRVVTGGGILGVVQKVGPEDEVAIEIAEGVRVRVLKATIQVVLSRTEPVSRTTGNTRPADAEGSKSEISKVDDSNISGASDNSDAQVPAKPLGFIGRVFGQK